MDTITNIETVVNAAGENWVYCTFEKSGVRYVAQMMWTHSDIRAQELWGATAWIESHRIPNRPYTDHDDAEYSSAVGHLDVKCPVVAPGTARHAVECALLRSVAALLNPGCREVIGWTQDRDALCRAGRAPGDETQELTRLITEFCRDSGRDFSEATLASFGSHRYVTSQ